MTFFNDLSVVDATQMIRKNMPGRRYENLEGWSHPATYYFGKIPRFAGRRRVVGNPWQMVALHPLRVQIPKGRRLSLTRRPKVNHTEKSLAPFINMKFLPSSLDNGAK